MGEGGNCTLWTFECLVIVRSVKHLAGEILGGGRRVKGGISHPGPSVGGPHYILHLI